MIEESTEELKRLGIQVITLVIQEVSDAHGYIDALGQKTVAEAKRDASIKVAQAEGETQQKTSDAQARRRLSSLQTPWPSPKPSGTGTSSGPNSRSWPTRRRPRLTRRSPFRPPNRRKL